MHARNSSWSIVLTSHSCLMGCSCAVLFFVFWPGVLLLHRFPVSVPWVLFSSSCIREELLGFPVFVFGMGGFSGSFVCSLHMPLSGYMNSVASYVSVGVAPSEKWHSSGEPLELYSWVFVPVVGWVSTHTVFSPLELVRVPVLVWVQLCCLVLAGGCLVVCKACLRFCLGVVVVFSW